MSAGAFQIALQKVNPRLDSQLIKGALFAATIGVVDIEISGLAVPNVGAIGVALLVITGVAACGRMLRDGDALSLSRMYLIRSVVAISAYTIVLSILGVLHQLIAKFDSRFRFGTGVLAVAIAVIVASAIAVFLVCHRPRILHFTGRLKSILANNVEWCIDIAELDELYSPSASRAPKVGAALTSTAALFGAYVVAKSSVFALFYVFVEALIFVLFVRACISLAYEANQVLSFNRGTIMVNIANRTAT